jgi:hypothetical protein
MRNSLRVLLIRAVAQSLKAWAEAVLAEAGEPAAPRAPVSPRAAATPMEAVPPPEPPEPVEEETSEGPPAQWLRDVQALHGGPPADWLKHARRSAAPMRAHVEQRPVTPAPPPQPVVEVPSEESREMEVALAEPALLPAPWRKPLRGEWLRPPRGSSGGERQAEQPVVSRPEPASPPDAAPLEPLVAQPPLSSEPRRRAPQPARPVASAEPRVEAPAPALPREEPAPTSRPEPVALSAEPPSPPPARRRAPAQLVEALAPLPSRPPTPVENVLAPPPASQVFAPRAEETPTPAWPSLPEEHEPPEPSSVQDRWPWPVLPEPPSTEAADGAVLLLYWERLSRLDREQRGE